MTTTEEVIRLAREAGVSILTNRKIDRDDYLSATSSFPALVRLIELVRAEENEACAKFVETQRNDIPACGFEFAAAIRARAVELEKSNG